MLCKIFHTQRLFVLSFVLVVSVGAVLTGFDEEKQPLLLSVFWALYVSWQWDLSSKHYRCEKYIFKQFLQQTKSQSKHRVMSERSSRSLASWLLNERSLHMRKTHCRERPNPAEMIKTLSGCVLNTERERFRKRNTVCMRRLFCYCFSFKINNHNNAFCRLKVSD